jgi:RNA polymerase sigma-70 factor (ECF subfamily)
VLEKRTGDRERAKDLQQEAFLIVLQKLRAEPLQDPSKLSAYLQNTAINLYIGEVRKEIRRNTTADSELIDAFAGTETDQFQELVQARAQAAVKQIIKELKNERDRKILTLYYIEESDKEQICQELDLSLRHFDRVISRARTRFRQLIEDNPDEALLEMST